MNDEIVPELAWQMGRPVRYGGEKGGVEERTRYMVQIAEDAQLIIGHMIMQWLYARRDTVHA